MQTISIDEVREFLKSHTFPLQPTQQKICYPIIRRIHRKMQMGVPFENINIDNLLLINGHHRYICSLLLQLEIGTNAWKSPSNTIDLKWSDIDIDANDWESIEIINRHNYLDAAKSGIDIKILEDLT
jgi:hypothetical protein